MLLPLGGRRTLSPPPECAPEDKIAADVARWRGELTLTAEQLAFVALRALLTEDTPAASQEPGKDGSAPNGNPRLENHD